MSSGMAEHMPLGTAKEVTERIIAAAEAAGANMVQISLNRGAMPHEMFMEQIRRFAREVLPALQAHEVKRVPACRGRACRKHRAHAIGGGRGHGDDEQGRGRWADSQDSGGRRAPRGRAVRPVQALDGYDLSAMGSAVPSITKAWSLPPSAFTQAFALSSVGIMVGAMAAGPIADRLAASRYCCSRWRCSACSRCSRPGPRPCRCWWRCRFFTGIGIGGAMPTTVALTSDYTPDRWRTSVVMFMFTGNTIGGFFAGQIAAQILPRWGWQGIIYVGGIVPLVLLVVLIFILPKSAAVPGRRPARRSPGQSCERPVRRRPGGQHAAVVGDLPDQPSEHVPDRLLAADGARSRRFQPGRRSLRRQHLFIGRHHDHAAAGPVIARCGAERVLATSFVVRRRSASASWRRCRLPHAWTHRSCCSVRAAASSAASSALNGFAAAIYPAADALDRHRLGARHRPAGRHRRTDRRRRAVGLRPGADDGDAVRRGPGLLTAALVMALGWHRRGR